jgi:carbon storage regulator
MVSILVLTRKPNQSIMIGDQIEISVLSVTGEKVRIGIQAPSDIPVFRTEIYIEIQSGDGQSRRKAHKPPEAADTGVDDELQELGESG